MLALLAQPVAAESIRAIEVTTYAEALRFCDRVEPHTESQAKFSLQHVLAAIAILGRPQLRHYGGDALHDPRIAEMRTRVMVHESPVFSARFPAHYGARVRVHWADGQSREHSVDDAWGDPELPLDGAALRNKFIALADWGGVPNVQRDALMAAIAALAQGGSLQALRDALGALQ
jgi:2-methylcitrate dehydratase PrpD